VVHLTADRGSLVARTPEVVFGVHRVHAVGGGDSDVVRYALIGGSALFYRIGLAAFSCGGHSERKQS